MNNVLFCTSSFLSGYQFSNQTVPGQFNFASNAGHNFSFGNWMSGVLNDNGTNVNRRWFTILSEIKSNLLIDGIVARLFFDNIEKSKWSITCKDVIIQIDLNKDTW